MRFYSTESNDYERAELVAGLQSIRLRVDMQTCSQNDSRQTPIRDRNRDLPVAFFAAIMLFPFAHETVHANRPLTQAADTEQTETQDADIQGTHQLDHNHPVWFDHGSYLKDGVEHVAVQTLPQTTTLEAKNSIGRTALGAVRTRAELWTGDHDPSIMENIGIDTGYVLANVVDSDRTEVRAYSSVIETGVPGTDETKLFCGYAQLRLTPDFKQDVMQRWKEYQTRSRLFTTGAIALGVFGLLAVVFSYLRLNHATRGFYSRRIMMGAAVVAIVVVLFCISLINHI